MNNYTIKNAIREELAAQVRNAISEQTICEAIHQAICRMDLSDMIEDAITECVSENIELVIEDMIADTSMRSSKMKS